MNERRFRFYTLYDRIWRRDTLETAWRLVAKEGKAAGVDGVMAEAVLARENGMDEFLTEVQEQLRSKKSYRPAPIRQVYIPQRNELETREPCAEVCRRAVNWKPVYSVRWGARRASLRAGSLVYSTQKNRG